jgi:lysophospholipase L1-like esterase
MSVRFSRGLLYVAAPLLFVQGRRVRRVTPKLAEPEGPREGETGTGALLKLLVLGDSAAAGVGARDQAHGLLGRTVEALAPHRRVAFKLIAKTGATSASTLKFLHKQPPIAIDAALVSLGVNDLTALGSTRTTLQHLAGIDAWLLSRGADGSNAPNGSIASSNSSLTPRRIANISAWQRSARSIHR